jgi:hypothetical protein
MDDNKFNVGDKLWGVSTEPFSFDPDVHKVSDNQYEVLSMSFVRGKWVYTCMWYMQQCVEEDMLFRNKEDAQLLCDRLNEERGLVPLTKEERTEILNRCLGR